MLDVLFIDILHSLKDKNMTEDESALIVPSPSFGYFSTYLKKWGINSNTIYFTKDKETKDATKSGTINQDVKKILFQERPKIIAFSPLTHNYKKAVEICREAKEVLPEVTTCIGNVHATAFPQESLKDGFDFVFLNDGFTTFPNFIRNILKGNIPDENIIIPNKYVDNVNTIPFLTIDSDIKPFAGGFHIGLLFSSFSCPYRCKFCSNDLFTGAKWMPMNPERVCQEINYQNENWGFDTFFLADPSLLFNEATVNRLVEINNLTNQLDFNCQLFISSRLDIIGKLDKENPQLLDQALKNVSILFVGVESINNKILNSYNKEETIDQIKRGIEALNKRDKMFLCSFIIGGPGDTHESIEQMIKFIEENRIYLSVFAIFTPYPLTRYYQEFEKKKIITTKDWDLYDLSHLVFKHPVFKPDELTNIKIELKETCKSIRQKFFMEEIYENESSNESI